MACCSCTPDVKTFNFAACIALCVNSSLPAGCWHYWKPGQRKFTGICVERSLLCWDNGPPKPKALRASTFHVPILMEAILMEAMRAAKKATRPALFERLGGMQLLLRDQSLNTLAEGPEADMLWKPFLLPSTLPEAKMSQQPMGLSLLLCCVLYVVSEVLVIPIHASVSALQLAHLGRSLG